jgi:CHAT domain-containing protein
MLQNDRPLAIPAVANALKSTWLVDVGQGDFAAAKIAAIEALDQEQTADSLWARALVHQLQGEYIRALELLETAFAATSALEQKISIVATAYWTELQATEILPDGFAFNSFRYPSIWRSRWEELKQDNPSDNLIDILELRHQIPSYHLDLIAEIDSERQHRQLQQLQERLTQAIELAQNSRQSGLAEFFYTAMARLLALAREEEAAFNLIHKLTGVYESTENRLGLAWCLLCHGDLITTAGGVGNPLLLGYPWRGKAAKSMEKGEFDRPTIDIGTAQEIYFDARQHFQAIASPRGEGAIVLRLAYLNGIAGQWHLARYGYEDAETIFCDSGDFLNAFAATMGNIWATIRIGETEGCRGKLAKLIEDGLDRGALANVYIWGVIFLYNSREISNTNKEQSLEYLRLVGVIFDAIDRRTSQQSYLGKTAADIEQWNNIFGVSHLLQSLELEAVEEMKQKSDVEQNFVAAEAIRSQQNSQQTRVNAPSLDRIFNASTPQEIAKHIPENAILLVYWLEADKLLARSIDSQGKVNSKKIDRLQEQPLQSSILAYYSRQWLEMLTRGNYDRNLGDALSQTFLEPFTAEIDRAEHLIIIPPLECNYLPFHALLWRGRLLSQYLSVSYCSSITQLERIRTDNFDTTEVLVAAKTLSSSTTSSASVANVFHGEASIIAAIYDVPIILNDNLTKSAFIEAIERAPKIIHFASIDLIAIEETACLSFNDGILTPSELSRLSWKTDTVVLNNCEANVTPDQIQKHLDIATSLLQGGVKSVLLNLWRSHDIATAMLMYFLHQNLRQGRKLSPSLKQAQQQLRQVTIAQALEFCRQAQAKIPWQAKGDRAERAILTAYMGDLMALGGDCAKAAEAYTVAMQILSQVGHFDRAKQLQNNCRQYQQQAFEQNLFQPNRLIFDAPEYWSGIVVAGNC